MKYVLVVMTNAKHGRENEFNKWYSNRHIPDILKVPGICAAQRFKLAQKQRSEPPYKYKYLAIYDLDTDDLSKTINALAEGRKNGSIPGSDAIDSDSMSYIFEPIEGRVVATL